MARCTRRSFMKGGALALFALGGPPRFLVRAVFAEGRATRPKILIAVFQRGAVDGLSMIVPHGDPDYRRLRPRLALPDSGLTFSEDSRLRALKGE